MEGVIAEDAEDEVRDAGLIAAGQRAEHYEMADYGTARTYAKLLGDSEGEQRCNRPLDEKAPPTRS